MRTTGISFATSLFLSTLCHAGAPIIYEVTDQSYDDIMFGLENALIDAGLVISEHNHIAEMLERTKADVGGTETIFVHADVLGFCSADLSRKAMEADPLNIRFCPYQIFAYQQTEESPVVIGYDSLPDGVMQDVQQFLDQLTRDAIGLD